MRDLAGDDALGGGKGGQCLRESVDRTVILEDVHVQLQCGPTLGSTAIGTSTTSRIPAIIASCSSRVNSSSSASGTHATISSCTVVQMYLRIPRLLASNSACFSPTAAVP